MELSPWRVTVTGLILNPLTDEQREQIALGLPGFAAFTDDAATGRFTAEFDVDAKSELGAVGRGGVVFGSTYHGFVSGVERLGELLDVSVTAEAEVEA